ncbi:polymorphic toxin-type HINT domain-containing protein [Psychrobacter sp. I-STPA10]|uniref:polymorphic toxin-type HINT domain-containing protein n=1 Tax=Psychrobacter sp. I-STPA10 TaxID=2585769 RepID=UPI001E59B05A|nr:polymorphic toxin-type HINT domain-containing protein [Psychrobacter sp. I-STPA10]
MNNSGFVAGTLVHTDKGLVPIQDIKVGDLVLSKSENGSGQVEYKPVLSTFKSTHKEEIYKVEYHNETAEEDNAFHFLLCNQNHPFWVTRMPNANEGEWLPAFALPAGYLQAVNGDVLALSDYSFLPVRTLAHFPQGCAYTQSIEEHDSWQYEDSTYDVMYLQLTDTDYHFISLSEDAKERKSIREAFCELRAIDPVTRLSQYEPIKTAPERFQKLDVLLKQDISPYYRSKEIYLNKMYSPFVIDGKVVRDTHIFDEAGFKKVVNRMEKYGIDLGADYGDSVHLSMQRYTDDCPNPYKAYVYNLEVADHHTYFVGHDGVWVHE